MDGQSQSGDDATEMETGQRRNGEKFERELCLSWLLSNRDWKEQCLLQQVMHSPDKLTICKVQKKVEFSG